MYNPKRSPSCLLSSMIQAFTLTDTTLEAIALQFKNEIRRGLCHQPSSLSCLPAHIGLPTGEEKGQSLSLDFGGTHVRAACCTLLGHHQLHINEQIKKSLYEPNQYDYRTKETTASALFDFLAATLEEVNHQYNSPLLGHTFSFPARQDNLQEAYLVTWTKEFAIPQVEGENVSFLLDSALKRCGSTLQSRVVINDTTAVLLASQYESGNTLIGSIYGTGHNTAFFDPTTKKTIINLECGNFNKLPLTIYDEALDKLSEKPGQQQLEKMASGRYIEALFHHCFSLLVPTCSASLTGQDLTALLYDTSSLSTLKEEEKSIAKQLVQALYRRSAQLVGATYAGILLHLYGEKNDIQPCTIAIDGSLYAHIPLIRETVRETLLRLLGPVGETVQLHYVQNGSIKGAAIAACMA